MEFTDLTPEQQEKAKSCKSTEDLIALAKSEGIELSDEQLESISGGGKWLGKCWQYCTENNCIPT